MRIHTVDGVVRLAVGAGVRIASAFDEGQTDRIFFHAHTVFAVVQERCAIAAFGHIHPFVVADLELCLIP